MAELDPEKRHAVWDQYEDHILGIARESLTRVSGPRGCEKNLWSVLDILQHSYFTSSSIISWPEDVQVGSKTKVHWTTTPNPPKTAETEAFWSNIRIPGWIDGVVESYVTDLRRQLWFKYRATVISNLQKALPACARPFEAHYTEFFLLKFVFRKFDAGFPEGRDEFEEWLEQLVKEVVAEEIPHLINNEGELSDEELVQLTTTGTIQILQAGRITTIEPHSPTNEAARVQLMERYSPKIKKIVAGIVYTHDLCPPSEDAPSFIEDAAQNVCVKIMANLGSYRFERPFRFWVRAICTNETLAERRDEVGRKEVEEKPVPRVYISWEELLEYGYSPVTEGNTEENTERADILKKVVDKYIEQGRRAEKSWRAIRLKWFEDLDVEEIAVRLNTTEGYVYKMFSHDYRELRRILDDFGSSGTDL
jgi:RNA polymerase sigma factor (sigma-70 family)